MERVYKNILIGVGMYAPEKMISVAFADKRPTLAELNMMFVSPTNETLCRDHGSGCKGICRGASEKTAKKKLRYRLTEERHDRRKGNILMIRDIYLKSRL